MITGFKHYQESNGRWVCEIKDTRPYLNILAFGKDELDAENNAKRIHQETLRNILKDASKLYITSSL